jgi:5,10-methylenetetrahydrofolate reductase
MHISQKLAQARDEGKPTFSFEFFPPKTAQVRHTLMSLAQGAAR